MRSLRYLAIAALGSVFYACDHSPTEPAATAPVTALSDTIPLTAGAPTLGLNLRRFSQRVLATPQSVTGRGVIFYNGSNRRFNFDATKDNLGVVTGNFEFKNMGTGLASSGNVVCFTIVGNTAYMSGFITKGDFVGFHAIWTAVDKGDSSAPDEVTPRFVALDFFHCFTPFNLALVPLKSGSIVIRP